MRAVEFVPREICLGSGERIVNHLASRQRHMRILPAPDEQQFRVGKFLHAGQRVVLLSLPKRGGVEIGRVATRRRRRNCAGR